jgi:hypothetical protein
MTKIDEKTKSKTQPTFKKRAATMLFSGLKTVGGFVLGGRALKKQAEFIKEDVSRFKSDLAISKLTKNTQARVDEWDSFVIAHGINAQKLKKQYRVRRALAVLLMIALIVCLYFIVVCEHYSVGVACLLISGLLYFQNNFRLYQIRHRQLCPILVFVKHAMSSFKECLPLQLSDDWCVSDKETGQNE